MSNYVHLPTRAIAVSMHEFERRANNPAPLTFGVSEVDARMNPLARAEVMGLIARPGMGKTYTLIHLAKHWTNILRKAYPSNPPLVLYATWETLVEEFMAVYSSGVSGVTLAEIGRGQANLKTVKNSLVTLMGNNLAVFGMSLGGVEHGVIKPPSLLNLVEGVEYLQSNGHNVGAICIDYLQRIPDFSSRLSMDNANARVSENLEYIKSFSIKFGIPCALGVQARREVDVYKGLKLPLLDDGQWTSNVEQTCDKLFSFTLPAKYAQPGEKFTVNRYEYEVSSRSMVLRMLKQRFGAEDLTDVWAIDFNPEKATLGPHPCLGEASPEQEDYSRVM